MFLAIRRTPNGPFGRISYGIEIPSIPELASYKVFARGEGLLSKEALCAKNP